MALFGKASQPKLWGPQSNQTKGEIDLRAEMHEILFGSMSKPQRGHWVIYRRFNIDAHTEAYDEVYQTSVGDVGYEYTDTLLMTRRDPMFAPEDNEKNTPMGILIGSRDTYFFEYDIVPQPNDQIIEFYWEDHREKPVLSQLPKPYMSKYNIKEVYPYRLDAARIEYWTVIVNNDRINY